MGRALVVLVTGFVVVCAALPVALNTYRPPPTAYTIVWTLGDCTATQSALGAAPDSSHPKRMPSFSWTGEARLSGDCP